MPPETQSAADAFDALRAEVGETRADLRKLAKTIADRPAPDYGLTLGEMAKQLASAERHLGDLVRTVAIARLPGELLLPHELGALTDQAKAAARELRAAAGAAIEQQAVRRRMAGAGALGALAGMVLLLGMVLGGAALFPRATGSWVAASILGGDPWDAGQALLYQADPATFERMVRLYQACPKNASTELCRAAMAVKRAAAPAQSSGAMR